MRARLSLARIVTAHLLLAALVVAAGACGESSADHDAELAADAGDTAPGDTALGDKADTPDADRPLSANAGESRYATVGQAVRLDASGSTGAVSYQWHFGDGSGWTEPREDGVAEVSYDAAGRYQAVLTVFDAYGRSRSDQAVISVTAEPIFEPRQSSTITPMSDNRVAAVSPDSNEVVLINWTGDGEFSVERRYETCERPRTVAATDDHLVVACQEADALDFIALDDGSRHTLALGWGARPFGVITTEDGIFVTLQGPGQLARIEWTPPTASISKTLEVIEDARGVSQLADGRVGVTRWRSPDHQAQIAVVDLDADEVDLWALAYDDQLASDTESGGVPSYLEQLVISPTGELGAIPSLQANIGQGEHRGAEPLDHQSTVRAAVSFVDLEAQQELRERRKLFDDRGLASAAVFSPRGDYLYVATRGSRTVERYDVLQSVDAGAIFDVGFAPQGLTLSEDGAYLFVDAYLSREIVVYRTSEFDRVAEPVARLQIPTREPLSEANLLGKRLFNDSFDPRLTKDGYIACAHCHLDGESDRRTWDFTDRGEGLRNTISLLGRRGTGHGPLHWSANFDEVQDFENDIRHHFGGAGLLSEASWSEGSRSDVLGDSKAGESDDLDALSAYVTSLSTYPRSPYRAADGGLSDAGERGKVIFESAQAGCTGCHVGADLTDSSWGDDGEPRLHDVGTLTDASGGRLGAQLVGIDTPTLLGVWNSAPYLHDGSAATLREVLAARSDGGRNDTDSHGTTSDLSDAQIDDLVIYLRSLDGAQ
jgi:6-phosphogluconolactonase (cycloisomerase 2 family)